MGDPLLYNYMHSWVPSLIYIFLSDLITHIYLIITKIHTSVMEVLTTITMVQAMVTCYRLLVRWDRHAAARQIYQEAR